MPITTTNDALKMLDAFETLRFSINLVRYIRDSNPVRKDARGRDVCRYCDAVFTDEDGRPVAVHVSDCPFDKAQATR